MGRFVIPGANKQDILRKPNKQPTSTVEHPTGTCQKIMGHRVHPQWHKICLTAPTEECSQSAQKTSQLKKATCELQKGNALLNQKPKLCHSRSVKESRKSDQPTQIVGSVRNCNRQSHLHISSTTPRRQVGYHPTLQFYRQPGSRRLGYSKAPSACYKSAMPPRESHAAPCICSV